MIKNLTLICQNPTFAKQVADDLAQRLDMQYFDAFDMLLFDDRPHTLSQTLQALGKTKVNQHLSSIIKYSSDFKNTIIVLNGTALDSKKNLQRVAQTSLTIYLHLPPAQIQKALQKQQFNSSLEKSYLLPTINKIKQRASFAKSNCNICINCTNHSVLGVVSEIIRHLQSYNLN